MGSCSIWCASGFCPRAATLSLIYKDISPLLAQLGLFHHLFADDIQAYTNTDPRDTETALTQMSRSIDVLTAWMVSNRLLLNPSKTQAIWLVACRQLAKIDILRLSSLFPPHNILYLCPRPQCHA